MYKILGADQKEYGPVTADQMRQWIAEGRANAQTMVLPDGETEWKALGSLPEFAETLAGGRAPAQPVYAVVPRTNALAITSLILGILSLPGVCCCYGIPFNVPGIICGIIGLSQIKSDPTNQTGRGLAIAGLICSIVGLLLGAAYLILILSGAMTGFLRDMKQL
jgi:hypothetical protein